MNSPTTDQRRSLVLSDVSRIVPEVRRLVSGHHTVGNWSLGQICKHLELSFIESMEGFDLSNHRIKRFFLKRKMLDVALTKGIPRNWTVDANLTPPSHVDLEPAVEALSRAVNRYEKHGGKLHAHPLFGSLSRDVWDRVHCVHGAHHLRFVIPE